MISEVTPRGKEFLFFSLFSIMGKTSAFIGPIVSSAIIDADGTADKPGNNSLPFYFLFGLSVLSMGLLMWFVDLKKSRKEQAEFLEEERAVRERRASVIATQRGEEVDISSIKVGNEVGTDVNDDKGWTSSSQGRRLGV